jgi:glucose/arabinose dehydrogenase
MKKGVKIQKVIITDGNITAYDTEGSTIKLTRDERNTLASYKKPDYVESIKKKFGNPNVLDSSFKVEKNGIVKFQL